MAIDDFLIDKDGASPPTPEALPEVHQAGDTTVFEEHASVHGNLQVHGNFLCLEGGPVLFPYDPLSPDDFGQQLNDFIGEVEDTVFPFEDGVGSATILLPQGEFVVTTPIEVPSGFFIRGFGTRYESNKKPGTTLLWQGDPNDWDGAPQDDQTPWKGFCVVFRGGYMSGLSHVRVDCTVVTSPEFEAPLVTSGRHGIFVGSLNNDGVNAQGITKQVRVEYVAIIRADIGIQHGNTTRMGANVWVSVPWPGNWSLTITGIGTTYTDTVPASPPPTNESIVERLVNMLNSPYPNPGDSKPVDDEQCFTVNHGPNFDIVPRNPSLKTLTVVITPPLAGGSGGSEDFTSATIHKQADFCEFRNCMVAGYGSRGMLLGSANNDLSLIERCVFSGPFIAIDFRGAGIYKITDVTCDPRPHQLQLVPAYLPPRHPPSGPSAPPRRIPGRGS